MSLSLSSGLSAPRSAGGVSRPAFVTSGYAANDNADGIAKYPGLIADFKNQQFAISSFDAATLAVASAQAISDSLAAAVFTDLFTFTRASTKLISNSDGTLSSIAINAIPYSYVGGVRSLSIESAVLNMALQSQTLSNASWVKNFSSVGTAVTDLLATTTAIPLIEDATTNVHEAVQNLTIVAATAYTFSCFLKAGTRRYAIVRVSDNASAANAASAVVDLQTGTISGAATAYGTHTAVSARINAIGATGYYRVELTYTSAVTAVNLRVQMSNDGTRDANGAANAYLGDGASNFIPWGFQHEAGAFATSYFPTTTTALTRNADKCQLSAKAHAIVSRAAASPRIQGMGFFGNFASWLGSGGAQSRAIGTASGGNQILVGSTSFITVASSIALPMSNLALMAAWDASFKGASYNGAAVVSTASTVDATFVSSGASYLGGNVSTSNNANGGIRQFTLWPFRVNAANLVSQSVVFT